MANDTRSSRGSKDDESNSSRKKPVNSKESSTLGSARMDASGLRRSTSEMPLQKQMSTNLSTGGKSEHLDRPMRTIPPVKRKSEIVEKLRIPSSSMRSDRGKEHLSLGCSGSMNSEKESGSSDGSRKKLKTEESLKKMDGRTFKCLIKLKRRRDTEPDINEESIMPEVISKIDSSSCGGCVSKPVDDGQDGAENRTSHMDAGAPPSSECKRDGMVGTHIPSCEWLRGQRFANNPEVGAHEVGKKYNKVVNNGADPASPRARLKQGPGHKRGDSDVPAYNASRILPPSTDSITHILPTSHASASTFSSRVTSSISKVHMVKSDEGTELCDVQKSLHVLLKSEIYKLCEILQISEDVKVVVGRFLEYVVDNHQVNREPITILEAFQISLCWIGASLCNYEIDKEATFALAKQHLNFGCTEEEVKNVHSKLRLLKKRFVAIHDFASDCLTSKQEQVPGRRIEDKAPLKNIKRAQKRFSKRMTTLELKHQVDIQELNKTWEDNGLIFEKQFRLELALIRSIHGTNPVGLEKQKRLEEEYAKKLKERDCNKGIELRQLKAHHLAEMIEERQKADCCLKVVKSCAQGELSLDLPSYGSELGGFCNHRVHDDPENAASPSGGLVEEASPNRNGASELEPSQRPWTANSEATGCGTIPIDTPIIQLHPLSKTVPVHANLDFSADAPDHNSFVDPHFAKQISDGAPSSEQCPPESFPNEVVGGVEFVEKINRDVEFSRELQIEDLDVSFRDPMAIQNDAAGSPTNSGSLEESSLVQPVYTLAQAGSLPQISALYGECSHSFNSLGMHGGDAQASENQDVLLQVEVVPLHSTGNGPTDQTNEEEVLIERGEQLQVSNSVKMHDGKGKASENRDDLLEVEVVSLHSTENGPTDLNKDEEALDERVEQLKSSQSTGMFNGEVNENHYGLQQVKVLQLHSADKGPTHQTNDEEGLTECEDQLQSSKPTEASENQDVPLQVEGVPLHSTNNGPTNQTNDEEAFTEHVEQLQLSKSTGVRYSDAEDSENQDGPQPTVLTNHKEAPIEGVRQLEMSPSSDSPVADNQPDVGAASGVEQLPSEGLGASQPFEKESEALDQVVIQSSKNLEPPPPSHAPIEGVRQPEMTPSSDSPGSENQQLPIEGLGASQLFDNEPEALDQVVIQSGKNLELSPEGVWQLEMSPSSDSPVADNQPDVDATSGVEQLPSEGLGASQPFDNEPEAVDQTVIQSGTNLELPPPIHGTDVPLGLYLQPAADNDHQPNSQGFMLSQHAESSSQITNQAVSHSLLGMLPCLGVFGTHLPLPQMPPQMLTQPLYGDPLLNELERLHAIKEQTIKIHEDTKVGLEFDCNKEIQEAIAEIRRKYADKLQNAESAFLLQKKEIDSNKKKVIMNKILADAFKSQCHAVLRTQPGVPFNVMQQHLLSSRPAPGSSLVTGYHHSSQHLSTIPARPPLIAPITPPTPFVHHSSPRFPTISVGPPLVASITPPAGNFQAGGEVRAPAPHLQRFRPLSSMPSTTFPSAGPRGWLPLQHTQRNLPTTSVSVPHVATTSTLVPRAPSHFDWGLQSGRVMEMPLENNYNQLGAPPNLLPPLQDLGWNFGSPDLPQIGARGNGGGGGVGNVAGSVVAADVVYLSDDD